MSAHRPRRATCSDIAPRAPWTQDLRDIVDYIRDVGPRKFRYHLDIEIRNAPDATHVDRAPDVSGVGG